MRTPEEAHEDCIGGYADNCWTHQLVGYLDNQKQLDKLNKHRNENRDMKWFNALIKAALILRHREDICRT